MRKDITVAAEVRAARGKNEARRLRVRGFIPAVLYGAYKDSVAIGVSPKELVRILNSTTGLPPTRKDSHTASRRLSSIGRRSMHWCRRECRICISLFTQITVSFLISCVSTLTCQRSWRCFGIHGSGPHNRATGIF